MNSVTHSSANYLWSSSLREEREKQEYYMPAVPYKDLTTATSLHAFQVYNSFHVMSGYQDTSAVLKAGK